MIYHSKIINNFYCGIIKVKVDADIYQFKKGETYFLALKYAKIDKDKDWIKIIGDINKEQKEHNKKMQKNRYFKIKKNGKIRKQIKKERDEDSK